MTRTPKSTQTPTATKKAEPAGRKTPTKKKPPSGAKAPSVSENKPTSVTEPNINPTTPPTVSQRRAGPLLGAIIVLVVFSTMVAGAAASRDVWWSYVAPYLPQATSVEDPRVATLMNRLGALEDKVSTSTISADEDDATFQELEQAREKLSAELAAVLQRLETVEKTVKSVGQMAEAVSSERDNGDTQMSLQVLVDRVNTLEQSSEQSPTQSTAQSSDMVSIQGRLDSLEQQTRETEGSIARDAEAVEDVMRRMESLEAYQLKSHGQGNSAGVPARASALILAVGQLRDAVRQGSIYVTELNSVSAVTSSALNIDSLVAVLQRHAESGVATRADLQRTFPDVAIAILQADQQMEGDGWFSEAVNRLSNLITVRRVEQNAVAESADSRIVRVEQDLAVGDLAATVQMLEGLSGPGAEAAEPWLVRVRATLDVEQALTKLNSVAIAQLSAAQG